MKPLGSESRKIRRARNVLRYWELHPDRRDLPKIRARYERACQFLATRALDGKEVHDG